MSSIGTLAGSPPQAAMNCERKWAWLFTSFATLDSQRRPVEVKQALRSLPAAFAWTHLKASSEQASSVFRMASTRVLLALPIVFSQSSTARGSMNGRIGVANGPVGATVKVGVGVIVGVGVRVGVAVRVRAVDVAVIVGVGVRVGQLKALQSALQQLPSAPAPFVARLAGLQDAVAA